MIFTKIRLKGLVNIDLPIVGATPSDKYILKAADGLGPPEVDVSIDETLYQGGVYRGRRPQLREIVLRVGLNPNWAGGEVVDSLKNEIYGTLSTLNAACPVQIMNNTTVLAATTGYVKRIEVAQFSKDPEVQITINCTQPYFAAPNAVTTVPTAKNTVPLPNAGTAPTGFKMDITFTALRATFSISLTPDTTTPPFMRLDVSPGLNVGDRLVIDTLAGERSIEIYRAAAPTVKVNAIGNLSKDSTWLELAGDNNTLYTSAIVYNWNGYTYTPLFWGV